MVTTDLAEPRETSGATTTLLLRYVSAEGGDAAVDDLLRRAGVSQSRRQLEDMACWVSYDTRLRLFDAATAVLGDPHAMRKVGAAVMTTGIDHALLLLLRGLGTPREVFRKLPRAVAKFTTTSTMTVRDVTSTSATAELRLHDDYVHSRLDCDYAQGLLTAIPQVFGLPPATMVHDRCQADGHPSCVYRLTWQRRRRFGRRGRDAAAGVEVSALRAQLAELQLAASDLVGSDDVEAVLDRITERAAAAVLAPAYLLVVDGDEGGAPPLVRSSGLDDDEVTELSGRLARGESLGSRAIVVDVASTRRRHGTLAAIFAPGQDALTEDQPLLAAYAQHAAAALDLISALEASRLEARRATALLALAHELAGATDTTAVAEIVAAAIPRIVGCRAASVMLWDASAGALLTAATSGRDLQEDTFMRATPVRADQTPELIGLLAHHEPVTVEIATASSELREMLSTLGTHTVLAMPLLSGDTLIGVATASWTRRITGTPLHAEALARIAGVTDQAATALDNARLLATVRHQSLHDALTGLPNRVLFGRTLDDALRSAAPDSGTAVLFCDLDRFKYVNDGHGHAVGDELLRQAAARLRGELRPGDVVGRLGGDEFGILLCGVLDERQPMAVADRLVERLDEPFRIAGHEIRITASVGVAVHSGPDGRGERLLAAADSAMYSAKQDGRSQVSLAGEVLNRRVVPSLEAELGQAVASGQLRLFFQPLVNVAPDSGAGVVIGAEALLRWAHPRLGLLAPGAFLPLAEESGLVSDLDLWAVEAACAELATWPESTSGPLQVAVNLASQTLVDPRLIPAVRAALTRHGLGPERLHLEVVESRSLIDLPGVIERLVELRQMGVRISLDDFGTGYSTLSWLQALPVDQIKIDRSFIMRLADHGPSLAVVRGVLALARELGIDVIAEGVEEAEQLAILRDAGCDLVQGYLLGRPAPMLDLTPPGERTRPSQVHGGAAV
ncbi:MAG TPA: sensor domain-containing phosphodiesterase [Actinotalea sp.]